MHEVGALNPLLGLPQAGVVGTFPNRELQCGMVSSGETSAAVSPCADGQDPAQGRDSFYLHPNTPPSVTLAQTPHLKGPRTDPDATGPRSLSPVASLPGARCPLGAGIRRERGIRGATSYVTALMVLVLSMSGADAIGSLKNNLTWLSAELSLLCAELKWQLTPAPGTGRGDPLCGSQLHPNEKEQLKWRLRNQHLWKATPHRALNRTSLFTFKRWSKIKSCDPASCPWRAGRPLAGPHLLWWPECLLSRWGSVTGWAWVRSSAHSDNVWSYFYQPWVTRE